MHFSPNKRQVSDPESKSLTIDGIPLKQVSETKFLGVTIDEKLTWLPHIEQLVKKTTQYLWPHLPHQKLPS